MNYQKIEITKGHNELPQFKKKMLLLGFIAVLAVMLNMMLLSQDCPTQKQQHVMEQNKELVYQKQIKSEK